MDSMAIYKSCADVTFAEVVSEIRTRYPDLNIKTASRKYADLMFTILRHAKTSDAKVKFTAKILMVSLISDVFTTSRLN